MTTAHAPQTVVAATLGTGRRSAPWPEGLPAAARAGADTTTALLDALALGAALGRAGRTPGTLDPGAVPPVAPPDERPAAPPRAATLLALHLEQRLWTDDVLAHWLRTCADRGFRVPHAQLPEVLRVAAAQPRLQPSTRAAAGARGAWLASLDPAQAWFTSAGTTHDPADWPLLGTADRVRLLFRIRATDPALGRELLASTWATDAADARRTLLPALRVGLGPADADLLEGALDDRAAGVRDVARSVLDGLPDSPRGARMAARLRPLLASRGLLRKTLAVEAPDDPDDAGRRDGLGDAPRGTSRRDHWLELLAAGAPLSVWTDTGLGIEAVARDAPDAARRGIAVAVLARSATAWAGPLLDRGGEEALVSLLPLSEAELRATVRLSDPQAAARLLAHLPAPWSVPLSTAVARRMRADPALAAALLPRAAAMDHRVAASLADWAAGTDDLRTSRERRRFVQHHSAFLTIDEAFA